MEQYINKSALVAEIKKRYNECLKRAKITDSDYWSANADAYRNVLTILNDTLEVKEVDVESYNKLKRTLSLAFMNFLDSNRREGKMCLSNGECYDIDKAFDEFFDKLFRYMEKYLKV